MIWKNYYVYKTERNCDGWNCLSNKISNIFQNKFSIHMDSSTSKNESVYKKYKIFDMVVMW